ncbi:hypothetical protein ABZ069_23190 [Streptomyces microflavus]|uniref:hypothetical protein n=1 Tax=Streptomyces microflavus TaxID=1919 RepID=UPI0033BD1A16
MNPSTLPRRPRRNGEPGWTHPYETGLFSPVVYADGGEPEGEDPEGGDPEGTDPDGDPEGEDPEGEDPDGDPDGEDPEGAADLGDKGKRALASMKGKWRTERDKRRELEKQIADKDAGDEAAQARREVEQAALSKANSRIVRSEVKAAAKGVLADPGDAYKFLDLGQFEVDDDGNIDSDEIAEAIETLVKEKPYLAAAPARRFQGTGDGGAARKASRPKQLTEGDLKKMTAEQIVKAQDDGRLDDLLGSS